MKLKFIIPIILAIILIFIAVLYVYMYPKQYKDLVEKYSVEYDVPEDVIYAVILNESHFDATAVSTIGASGLMQITEDTFNWLATKMPEDSYTYDDIFIPEVNIKYGTYFLKLLFEEFGDETAVYAAYHAGRSNVNKWLADSEYSSDGTVLEDSPYPSTNLYIDKVIFARKIYKLIYFN